MSESDTPTPPAIRDDAYDALLADVRAIIASGRGRTAAAVNVELVLTYWGFLHIPPNLRFKHGSAPKIGE